MYLETERLIIRNFSASDLSDLHEMLGDPDTMRFLEPAYTRQQTDAFLKTFCMEQGGAMAAVEKNSGKLIGYFLFHACGSPDCCELGWIVHRDHRRRGYAYEACLALIEFGFRVLGLREIFAETVDGISSVGLMKKLGMKPGEVEPGEENLYIYHLVGTGT